MSSGISRILADRFSQEPDGRVHVLLLVVVLEGAPCLGVEEERPVVPRTKCQLGLLRRRYPASSEHRQRIASDNILHGERITHGKCLGPSGQLPAVGGPNQGVRNPHLVARKLDDSRQNKCGAEFRPGLFDRVDPRLAYLTGWHHLKIRKSQAAPSCW